MSALEKQINQTLEKSHKAFAEYKKVDNKAKAAFLYQIAKEIENIGDVLIETVMEESLLPEMRVRGERGRTTNQIQQFAKMLEEGSWLEAIIETGIPDRVPAPKPDLRKMMVPMGPVVVFGAGNFPLAFSVAGGDTASVLAGGNPVVVKGHPAHPKTGKLVANAILKAVDVCEMPEGTFGYIDDSSYEAGQLLVKHPFTKAVAFTGSEKGGRALFDIANKREEPIPVFAEMGSINPVLILPAILKNKPKEVAQQLVNSVNLGAGQFCTNPGLIITQKGSGYDTFIETLTQAVMEASPTNMYSEGILKNYKTGLKSIITQEGVALLNTEDADPESSKAIPVLGTVDASYFKSNSSLHQEIFGPFSLIVTCETEIEVLEVIKALKGQLTCTVFNDLDDLEKNTGAVEELTLKCGRLLFNGVPTGVEVCAAMQHGGPYPASTDSRFTSVGLSAVKRFVRPVSYQDCPDQFLPKELQNNNPLGIWRLLNGEFTKNAVRL